MLLREELSGKHCLTDTLKGFRKLGAERFFPRQRKAYAQKHPFSDVVRKVGEECVSGKAIGEVS